VITKKKRKANKFDASVGWPPHCIVDGCRARHTGPRFRFLCVEHRAASAKKIRAWQTAYYTGIYETVDRVSVSLRRVLVSYGIVPKGRRAR
jgi:hypothetical protein